MCRKTAQTILLLSKAFTVSNVTVTDYPGRIYFPVMQTVSEVAFYGVLATNLVRSLLFFQESSLSREAVKWVKRFSHPLLV